MRALRHETVESSFHIPRDIGIVAFVHQDARCRVRYIQMANAGFDPGIANEVLDFGSGIFEFRATGGPDCDLMRGVCAGIFSSRSHLPQFNREESRRTESKVRTPKDPPASLIPSPRGLRQRRRRKS